MQILLVLHSLLRWFVILFGIWTIINAIVGIASKKEFRPADSRSNFFFMLSMDIQLLIGLGLYFSGMWFQSLKHLHEIAGDTTLRFFTIEHESMMIIAWILVHAGRVVVKRATTSSSKFNKSFLFFGITLLLILIATPWPFREAVSRPWFRWF